MSRGRVVVFLFHVISRLPFSLAQGLGAALGRLLDALDNETRRVTRRNIARCLPELDSGERRRLVRENLMQVGRTSTETAAIWLWPWERVSPLIRGISGEELLTQAVARGRGVIIAAPHLGNWEIIGPFLSSRYAMTIMYRPPKLVELDDIMRRARERVGAHLVPTDASGVRALMKALKQGELVGILPDQEPGRESGVFAPFFGHPANTMVLLPKLARKTGATVLFLYAERLAKGGGFQIHIRPAPQGIDDADLVTAATSLNRGVEECVRALPAQYQWGYKRFKARRAGDADFYARDGDD